MRAIAAALAAVCLLVTWAGTASAQRGAADASPAGAASVWDDPERFRALAERTEPWPLRNYPPPWGQSVLPGRCRPDERTEIRLGPQRTRLWVQPFPTQITSPWSEYKAYQRWESDELVKERACPGDRSFRADSLNIYLAESISGQLDPRCFRGGLPPDPRPECDRPAGSGWYRTFVLGLPHLIEIRAPDPRYGTGDIISGLHDHALRQPDLERLPTRRGNELLTSRGGQLVHGTVLARIGDPTDTSEPLFVSCSFEWGRPERASRVPFASGRWMECGVRYRFRGALDLSYRFYREIFDEPDIPALDLRVRDYVRAMLTPPSADR